MKIIKKGKQKYLQVGKMAVPFNAVDENGNPVIKPKIEKTKTKDGRDHVVVKIPAMRIKINRINNK